MNFGSCKVEMRVMDNAVAYRFVTNMRGEILVDNEHFTIVPESGFTAHYQQCGSFNTAYEERYQHKSADEWIRHNRLATVPMLLSGEGDSQLLIGESDVDDYPRLFPFLSISLLYKKFFIFSRYKSFVDFTYID